MKRKTADQILLYLVKTAKPERFIPPPDSAGLGLEEPDEPLQDLLVQLSGVTSYTVRLSDFQAFLGEAYSFEKHIRKLHEAGHIHCPEIPEPGDYYDTPQYRESFDGVWGLEDAGGEPETGLSFVFQFNTDDDEDLNRVEPVLAYARGRRRVERDPWKTATREQLLDALQWSGATLKSTQKLADLQFRLIADHDFSGRIGEEAGELLKVLEAVCTKLKRDAQDALVGGQ